MGQRRTRHVIRSNVFVAISTAILVNSLHSLNSLPSFEATPQHQLHLDTVRSPLHDNIQPLAKTPKPILQQEALSPPPSILTEPPSKKSITTSQSQPTKHRVVSQRIDLSSCPSTHIRVAPKVNSMVGMGHKMTETFYVFWYAMTRGHCFCFDTQHFGDDPDIYHLLLEPILPPCDTTNHTLVETTVRDLEKQNVTLLAASNDAVIQWIYPDMSDVWPRALHETVPLGHGDVLAFVDSFLRDNRLLQEVIRPWYQQHTTIANVFHSKNNNVTSMTSINDSHNSKVLNAAFHIRVGDLILEASESYWRNVLAALKDVVDLEHGPGYTVHIYWMYFRAMFRGGAGDMMRASLAKNVMGEWPSKDDMLPTSHLFLAKLCSEFEHIECFWKSGTNILETIDLFVQSDIVYVSGSSFSQVLSLFNEGIKLLALPKEVNYFGTATKGSVPFLKTSTGAFSSLRYYYIDGTGGLFDEHLTYLRLNQQNHTSL